MAAPFSIYARALFELSEETSQTSGVIAGLRELSRAFNDGASVRAALGEGLLDVETRVRVVRETLRASGASLLVQRFVILLAQRGRLADLPEVVTELDRLLNKKSGVVVGELRSAVELAEDETKNLANSIGKKLGVKVEFRNQVDPTLLGGFVARVSGRTFDSSLRTQLEKLRTQLSQ